MSTQRRRAEWIETDGLGGFASGTVDGIRTRRYHALLLAATSPPTGRVALVQGVEAWIETRSGSMPLGSQLYRGDAGDVVHPDGADRIERFESEPWPCWRFRLAGGAAIEHEIFARDGVPVVCVSWKLVAGNAGEVGPVTLCVRPLLSGRDYHALHHENPAFRFEPERQDERLTWRPYDGVPAVTLLSNGRYSHEPVWYRDFVYEEERARGLDATEDLASPGVLRFDLDAGPAEIVLAALTPETDALLREDAVALSRWLRACERDRRSAFPSRLHRAADAYLVRRGMGRTVVAGYPWFTDWGRDTFIALRGLCLATGRLETARDILLEWSDAVSEGMLPNRFPDRGEAPEYNSVDASLWYVVAVHDLCRAQAAAGKRLRTGDTKRLQAAVRDILTGYAAGTRYGIRMDADGLLAAGEPGWQLTWMDAKVGDWVVTPRIGKPVEIQALWLNALWFASTFAERWRALYARACEAFQARFWNESGGYLYDVVDAGHVPGAVDPAFRPNQILAVGGLPLPLLEAKHARRVVDAVESRLWTPLGLRSLAPREPAYAPRYEGDPRARDAAYHQGTVWPWLLGPFVDAWVRVRGTTPEAIATARARFLEPVLAHLDDAGIGHVAEIADAEPPHTPRGCPFQAWSLGEILRLEHGVLAPEKRAPARRGRLLAGTTAA